MLPQVRFERAPVGVAQAAAADHPVRETALRQVCASRRIPPQCVPVQSAGGVQHQLLLECQPVPTALRLAGRRGRSVSLASRWCRCPRQPGARLANGGELLAEPDEVKDIAPGLAAKAHEALAFYVHEEARIPVRVERAEPLPSMRPGPSQTHSRPLDYLQERVGELDGSNVPVGYAGDAIHGRSAVPLAALFAGLRTTPTRGAAPGWAIPASSASSRGLVVARRCSAGLASIFIGQRPP